MSPCGVGSPVHLDNQPASTVATLASVKPTVIRHISLHIPTELDTGHVWIPLESKHNNFAKSNSSYPFIDLIFLLILSIHVTLILSYPSLHVHYLTFFIFLQIHWFIIMTSDRTKKGLSTRMKEGDPHWPTQTRSGCLPTHQEAPESCPQWGQAYQEPEQVLLPCSPQSLTPPLTHHSPPLSSSVWFSRDLLL